MDSAKLHREQRAEVNRLMAAVPPRGSLAASRLAQIIKDLRKRKIKPFYYSPEVNPKKGNMKKMKKRKRAGSTSRQ
jgi:hypothetical protein